MENSKIAWTDHTFNPWWGCAKVSDGCKNCYADAFSRRTGNDVFGVDKPRRFFGDKHWNEPLKWNEKAEKAGHRAKVFCASMADVFEHREDLKLPRKRLFALIEQTPYLIWLLLTKRPENIFELSPRVWLPDNIWLGVTVENQEMLDSRISLLSDIPAKKKFLSVEPMLGAIEFDKLSLMSYIDWVIVGGESGANHRPFDWGWARDIRDQCRDAGVPFFMKQGAGKSQRSMPEIPEDLMIREFPE